MNATQEIVQAQVETQVQAPVQAPVQPQQKTRLQNPLSARHFEQVVKRPHRIRERMQSVIGLTWNLYGRIIVPLGAASACVQYTNGEMETQLCITGSSEPDTGEIRYQTVRMSHSWARNPVYGGYGPVLDPREPNDPACKPGDKPNASWVRLGLALDSFRMASSRDNTVLSAVPRMPKFLVGMPEMPDLVDATAPAIDEFLATTINPGDPLNPSTGYLVPREYLTPEQYIGLPVYEDFRGLIGMEYPNPLSELTQIRVQNPVWSVARRRRIFLKDLLAALDTTAQGENKAVDEDCEILLSGMREMLGITADMFLEDDLINALRNPQAELVSTKGIADLSVEERVEKIVEALRFDYYIMDGCTEADIRAAAENPHRDLFASGTCGLQAFYRDAKLPIDEALTFGPVVLGVSGVSARFFRERR